MRRLIKYNKKVVFILKKLYKGFLSLLVAVVLILGLTACDNDSQGGKLDSSKTYSDITNDCKLDIPYEGKSFLQDGIEKATLTRISDGDTMSFKLESGTYVTIRFYGIDTPESTGEVDKWGLSASLFAKSTVNSDCEFVLESSTGGPAEKDSYGTRYLGYVWYRENSNEEFKNLNLLIVENGYSKSSIQNSPQYEYYPFFKKAETFAKEGQLHIWSDDDDPNYSDAAFNVSIKEIKENQDQYWNEENGSGSKVRLNVTIIDCVISESGTHTFTGAQVEDGVLYTYNVYTGYASAAASSYLKIGNTYDITGFIQCYYDEYQISGLNYVLGEKGEGYVSQIEKESYLTFDSSIEYITRYQNNLKTSATVKNAEVSGTKLTLTVTADTVTKNGLADELTDYTITVDVTENFDVNTVLNKTMTGNVYKSGENYIALSLKDLQFN